MITKAKNTVPWTYVISARKGEEIEKDFKNKRKRV